MDATHLEKTTREFVSSLLGSKSRHTLCLSIAEPGFQAEEVVKKHLDGQQPVEVHVEPDVAQLQELAKNLAGKVTVLSYADLDIKPKIVAALIEHMKNPNPGGKLIVVSKQWSADNAQLRKACLFYQQNLAKPPKEGK